MRESLIIQTNRTFYFSTIVHSMWFGFCLRQKIHPKLSTTILNSIYTKLLNQNSNALLLNNSEILQCRAIKYEHMQWFSSFMFTVLWIRYMWLAAHTIYRRIIIAIIMSVTLPFNQHTVLNLTLLCTCIYLDDRFRVFVKIYIHI